MALGYILALLSVVAFALSALKVDAPALNFDGLGKCLFVAALLAGAWGGMR